jgi:hypothetical protein
MALSAVPLRSVLVDLKTLLVQVDWVRWLQSLKAAVDSAAQQTGVALGLTTQSASLPATTVLDVVSSGLYRVNYYTRITQAATTSSSVTVTIRWTDGGVACLFTNAAITGNTTGSNQQSDRLLHADQGTVVTIETAYASVGATPMQYRIDARVERMP